MYIHLYIKVSLIVLHEGSRTAIQDTLKTWCLGSHADLAYSSYSDVASLRLVYCIASSTHIVHPVITKHTEAELVTACMPTRLGELTFGKQAQLLHAQCH